MRKTRGPSLALLLMIALLPGCFWERSFPLEPHALVPLNDASRIGPVSTRAWLAEAHAQLEELLPIRARSALLTEELSEPDGSPTRVARHFWVAPGLLHAVWYNLPGILYSAQASGTRFDPSPPPGWAGFEDIWIPIDGTLELSGRLGFAKRDGAPVRADCIVLVPGLFGDNWTTRSRDLAEALLEAGYHVLSLEQRGHGQTQNRYPDVAYTYGTYEAGDLLAVAEWLQARREVNETGLIGFCWGANQALLTAWEDGRAADDADVSPALAKRLRERGEACYRAGIIAFSPPVRFEDVMDRIEEQPSVLMDPVTDQLGKIVAGRAEMKGFPPGRSLWSLVQAEAQLAEPNDPEFSRDGLRYLRLLPYRDEPAGAKLNAARMPVLVVHAANDPIGGAQAIADLISTTDNPNVAAIILPDGGHCGFAAYARSYFYSLVLNYFDRDRGAAACAKRALAGL